MLQLPVSDVVARYIQQFYSGRLLMNEIRDHIQRWMSWGETSYGSMIEIGDEGHFAMPLDNLGVVMDQFDQDRPAWWTPQLRTRCLDTFRNMQQYYFRHSAPGGAFHRFDHTEPEGNRFLNFRDAYRTNPVCGPNGCGVTNRTRHIVVDGTYAKWVLAQINMARQILPVFRMVPCSSISQAAEAA